MKRLAVAVALALLSACTTAPVVPAPAPLPTPAASPVIGIAIPGTLVLPPSPAPASRVIGITLDNPWDTDSIVAALKQLPRKPWVRVVFDAEMTASAYRDVLAELKPYVAGIMGELLDSQSVKGCSQACYESRARAYIGALGEVDVWEVCNEINGDEETEVNWVGDDAGPKCLAALRIARAAGKRTAVTFYLQPSLGMFRWIEKTLAPADRALVDWALVSFYAKDNGDWKPDWPAIADRLGQDFPGAQIGVGEMGDDRDEARARAEFTAYYRTLEVPHPRWLGGFFDWYQWQFVGKRAILFGDLAAVLR